MPAITQDILSRHEAGHAIAARVLGCVVFAVSAREGIGGICRHSPPDGDDATEREIIILAAGNAANAFLTDVPLPDAPPQLVIARDAFEVRGHLPDREAIEAPLREGNCVSDFDQIEVIARRLQDAGESKLTADQWHQIGCQHARIILEKHKYAFQRVAATLARDGAIVGVEQFEAVFHGRENSDE
jgi:hypothetical protein